MLSVTVQRWILASVGDGVSVDASEGFLRADGARRPSSIELEGGLLPFQVNCPYRQIPVGVQNFKASLFLVFVNFLVGEQLFF